MAKTVTITDRFPFAGVFFVIAVALAVPLTVWSLNHAPTQTKQQAAGYTCGANNQKPTCPAGYACSYIQGNPTFGGTCYTLAVPTGLHTDAKICKPGNGTEYDLLDFNWKAVSGALTYRVYYKVYGTSTYSYKDTTSSELVVASYKNLNGRHIQWYVRASSGTAYSVSSVYVTSTPTPDCYWMTTP